MAESLKNKTVKGLGWSAVDNVSKLGITFIVGIVLARLLGPEEYGLIGILTIFISVFNSIVDSGFSNALIRMKHATDADLSTAFYTNLCVSVVMAIICFFLAKPLANFFQREELVALTRCISIVIVINAFCLVQRAIRARRVDFKTQTKVTVISSLASGFIGILMAYLGYGVWALVAQQIAAALFTAICYWIFNKWFPKLVFSKESFKSMWSYGWKLLVSQLIGTVWKEIYQVVIGKCYAPATLGLYTRAKQFSAMFSSNLTTVIQRVSFPVLSSIQDDKTRLREAYRKIIKSAMLPTFVLMFGMAAVAKPMILVLIGEKWLRCIGFLILICINGSLYPLHAINLNMLQVQGRSDLFLRLEIIKKVISIGPILLGIFIDIYLMVGCSIITGFIAFYINAYYSGPFLNYSIKDQIKDIIPSFLVAITMAIPVGMLQFLDITPYIVLPIQIILGAAIVITICELKKLPEYLEIKGIVMPMINKVIKRK
ncbi:lipopolysaccharide biosynthesis protein [Sodaliphilus sp.]|uniref:lipopolysaccharide biosynthesis protein n=1 Tax=Sodaliphilus sp. TaxID=2815818 RepID=UPI00388FC2EF